jgi:protein-tyrosine phosphatase
VTAPPAVPPARTPGGTPYRVALVCLGNICRSPMAAVVLTARLAAAGLDRDVEVVSAGTGGWHLDEPMDRRAATLLTAHGYDASLHRSTQFVTSWFGDCDLVLAMDAANHTDLVALRPDGVEPGRLRMYRDFDPRAADDDRDVPDPYFGGDDGFTAVLAMVERTSAALVTALSEALDESTASQRAGG